MNIQKCKVCGCTELAACVTAAGPCSWVEADLCSGCAAKFYNANGFRLDKDSLAVMHHPVLVEMDISQVMMLISTVQLACRNPGFNGPTRLFIEGFARNLQAQVSVTSQLAWLLAAGWGQRNDTPAQRRIIAP